MYMIGTMDAFIEVSYWYPLPPKILNQLILIPDIFLKQSVIFVTPNSHRHTDEKTDQQGKSRISI